ncbi:transcriptional regulator TrmB [Isoptericola sp. NPDC057559]|uniref:transcriptional regulator TrmB n=1 Tax=Isoptericola sp. NPDC057559 TaxID=3346168 RepID=UPI00367C3899
MELEALGIGRDQEAVYRTLVAAGPASEADLRTHDVVAGTRLEAVLADLLDAGLLVREGARFRASPPELALRSLVVRRRSELGRAENALAELTELFRVSSAGSMRDMVEVLTGADAVRQRFVQLQHAATTSVRAFVRADPLVLTAEENPAEDEAVRRGVAYQVILERGALEGPGALALIEESVAAGEEVRRVDSLPLRMLIVDDDLALVPLAASGETGAVAVRRSGLLDALVALFDQYWARAVPVVGERVAGEAELDGRIVSLLLQGYGDRSVAAQLDVSPRTVQRRIRALMDEAGVNTRMQLGHAIGRRRGED